MLYINIKDLTLFFNIDTNPCSSSPCLNGGSCLANSFSCSYQCQCPAGYTGSNCQMIGNNDIDINFQHVPQKKVHRDLTLCKLLTVKIINILFWYKTIHIDDVIIWKKKTNKDSWKESWIKFVRYN